MLTCFAVQAYANSYTPSSTAAQVITSPNSMTKAQHVGRHTVPASATANYSNNHATGSAKVNLYRQSGAILRSYGSGYGSSYSNGHGSSFGNGLQGNSSRGYHGSSTHSAAYGYGSFGSFIKLTNNTKGQLTSNTNTNDAYNSKSYNSYGTKHFESDGTNSSSTWHSYSSRCGDIAAVGAALPPSLSVLATDDSPLLESGRRKVNDSPNIPFGDPIGELPLALMLLLASSYSALRVRRFATTNKNTGHPAL